MTCPPVSSGDPIYFYHSFHRAHEYDPDRRISLAMLGSMLKRGLLMVGEVQELAHSGELPAVKLEQHRICFTALEEKYLPSHHTVFGDFSIEFEGKTLREFGGLPAAYLTSSLTAGALLHDVGDDTIRNLFEAEKFLRLLRRMSDSPDPLLREARERIMASIYEHPKHPAECMQFSLQTILNLYYPTDLPSSSELQFFRQREWKIVPNSSFDGKWLYLKLSDDDRQELRKIAPKLFDVEVSGEPRINRCRTFAEVGGRHLVHEARRIIVPDAYVAESRELVIGEKLSIPVVPISALPVT